MSKFAKDPDAAATLEYCREHLSYDPLTGLFIRTKTRGSQVAGTVAGHLHSSGYLRVRFADKHVFLHRLAWLVSYGKWPEHTIDHLNGLKVDNRLTNLRDATVAENNRNRENKPVRHSGDKANTSGYRGVSWHKQKGKWRAFIRIAGKRRFLGYFTRVEDAAAAYAAAVASLEQNK